MPLDEYANGYLARAMTGDSVPRMLERGFDYGTYRLTRFVGLQVTGGSMSVRGTGQFGMTIAGGTAILRPVFGGGKSSRAKRE